MPKKGKKPQGRPPNVIPPIPDTFENVVKAVVRSAPPKKPAESEDEGLG